MSLSICPMTSFCSRILSVRLLLPAAARSSSKEIRSYSLRRLRTLFSASRCSFSSPSRAARSSSRTLRQAVTSAASSACAGPGFMFWSCVSIRCRSEFTRSMTFLCSKMRALMAAAAFSDFSARISTARPALSRPLLRLSFIKNSISTGFIVYSSKLL